MSKRQSDADPVCELIAVGGDAVESGALIVGQLVVPTVRPYRIESTEEVPDVPRRRASKALRPCAHEPDDLRRGAAGGRKRRRDVPASLLDRAGHEDAEISRELGLQIVVRRSSGVGRQPIDPRLQPLGRRNIVQSTDRSAWATLSIRARILSGFVVSTV